MDDTGQRRVPVMPPSALRQFQVVAFDPDDASVTLTRGMTQQYAEREKKKKKKKKKTPRIAPCATTA